MRCLRLVYQGGKLAFCTMACWLAVQGMALAQGLPKKEDNGGGSYVLPYFLLILGVGLGMLLVCRASHRRDRARPESYDETKVNIKEG
jgi:SNF family Na+-dependent transporter